MLPADGLVYDIEIYKAIHQGGEWLDDIEYCKGFHDKANMGITVIAAFDLATRLPHIFLKDNFDKFVELAASREHIIGFFSKEFDDEVCCLHGIQVKTTYDLHEEVKIAAGHSAKHRISGYGLDKMAYANFGEKKSMDGADAPIEWQRGNYGKVIDYCLRDVMLAMKLLISGSSLTSPVDGKPLKPLRSLLEGKYNGPQVTLDLG